MAEYIEREALINAYDLAHVGPPGGARKLMLEAPAVDVVPVVRCKDCKHADKKTRGEASVYTEECLICTEWPTIRRPVMPDGFCNYGRRVEDAVN